MSQDLYGFRNLFTATLTPGDVDTDTLRAVDPRRVHDIVCVVDGSTHNLVSFVGVVDNSMGHETRGV